MLNAILSLFRMILLILGGYEQIALENLALREQLAIFQRSVRHPKIRLMDRVFWVCLRKVWRDWKSVLVIVRPETVLDWQRRRFRRYRCRLSQHTNPGVLRKNSVPNSYDKKRPRRRPDAPSECGFSKHACVDRDRWGILAPHALRQLSSYPRGSPTRRRGDFQVH